MKTGFFYVVDFSNIYNYFLSEYYGANVWNIEGNTALWKVKTYCDALFKVFQGKSFMIYIEVFLEQSTCFIDEI